MSKQMIDFDKFVNYSQLFNPLVGGAEKEADTLRKEILTTDNTENYYEITGTKYYVSASGNDCNDGLSAETAFLTASKLDELELKEGDAVLFERGSTFRLTHQIMASDGITYGSYGNGKKPELLGSPKNFAKNTKWLPAVGKNNVWWTSFPYQEAYNIVFEKGKYFGKLKGKGDTWCEEFQFAHDLIAGVLYLYSEKGDPSTVYSDIEVCPSNVAFSIPFDICNVTVDNLCIKYFAGGGVSGGARNNNISVTNCEIGFIGGVLARTLNVRMGNAVGMWAGNIDLCVDHNWIYQTFDTAISPQGRYGLDYKNISFCDNLLEFNGVDFEWFDRAGAEFCGFKCDGNIMRFTSLGWGNRLDDAGIRGIEGCIRAYTVDQTFTNFSFKNNIIDCPGRQIINWLLPLKQLNEIHTENNKVYVNAAYRKVFPNNPAFLIGLHETGSANVNINATNQNELEKIWKYFDTSTSSTVKWYDQ